MSSNPTPPGPVKLTPAQQKMLSSPFYIDAWHNIGYFDQANALVEQGLLTVRKGGDSQYTSYHYEPSGRAALEQGGGDATE